ncbi:hypothetical protein DSL64_21580 [Dyadobacter luteus]|uniref:Lantibiotic dehydratase n=1 Tax=Dyadobacter luteus TaxID=2259619 RepID=A0A3D8Y9G6_9BACT|nr:lantibiotic dehydratase [Dyadobacter luteus]REA58202.1 hypothetical protein DSL64_21580 [Dyadobacter luteus]
MKIKAQGFCMVRRPVLSRNVLEDFNALINRHPEKFESELKRIFSDSDLLEGLALSCGPLYDLVSAFTRDQPVKGKEKVLQSLYKFLIRASSRPIPFGLFAGYFIMETADTTQVSFQRQYPAIRHNQLDVAALEAIKEKLLEYTDVRKALHFYPSSSLYRVGNYYRYMKRVKDEEHTSFVLKQAAYHPVLEKLLNEVKGGMRLSALSGLVQAENFSDQESRAYIASLIQAQMLVSSMEISVIGEKDYLSRLADRLTELKVAEKLTEKIRGIQIQLRENAAVTEINTSVSQLLGKPLRLEQTIHTTLRFQTEHASISSKVLSTLASQFSRIGFLRQETDGQELKDFTRRFTARYWQRSVPLLVALDYEYGVGYGALSSQTQPAGSLLDGIEYSPGSEINQATQRNDLSRKLYEQAFLVEDRAVMLTDRLLDKHRPAKSKPLAESFYVIGSFHSKSQGALDKGDFVFELKGLSGPGACDLLTRFCVGDPELSSQVKKLTEIEQTQSENLIYAEIAHLPAGKGGNVLQRPDLTPYQITYLSAGAGKNSIAASDLQLSCLDGENLVLSCPRLGKQIMPLLTSAHHYSGGLPVYRFLCDLANQKSIALAWDWGHYSDAAFLPRVQYRQIVLSKASWLLTAEPPEVFASKVAWWQDVADKLGTPRYFTVGEMDQTLLIDSENEQSLALLAKVLKRSGEVRVTESLETPDEGILGEAGAYFSNEFVIPFLNKEDQRFKKQPRQTVAGSDNKIARYFNVGSSWLYVKIYCAEKLSDTLISTVLKPFVIGLQADGSIDKWFFIRYRDPDPHLRIRFHSEKTDFWSAILAQLYKLIAPLIESGMVRSIHTDNYERELERFEPSIYERVESLFHCDSQAVTQALELTANNSELRWQGALLGTDLLLKSFDFDMSSRENVIRAAHEQFSAELDKTGTVRIQMDQNYRAQKSEIIQILGEENTDFKMRIVAYFRSRDQQVKRTLKYLESSDQDQKMKLCSDLVHLSLNRWFDTLQRKQEFAVYHYLKKYYTSRLKSL